MDFISFDSGGIIELSGDYLVKNSRECYRQALPFSFLLFSAPLRISFHVNVLCVLLLRFSVVAKRKTHHFETFTSWNSGDLNGQKIQCTKVSKMEECPVIMHKDMVCYRVQKNLYSLSRTINMLELNGPFVSSLFLSTFSFFPTCFFPNPFDRY